MNIKNFKSKEQITNLINDILKEILNNISDDDKKNSLENVIKQQVPEKTMYFKSPQELCKYYNTSKKGIIENSILLGYPDIDRDFVPKLKQEFRILVRNKKVRIDLASDTPVFNEIFNIMSYAKRINNLLKEYPLQKSTHNGTKATSTSVQNMIKTQISSLEDRLYNPYFKTEDDFEIKKITHQLKVLKKCQEKGFEDLPEIINTAYNIYGLDSKSDESSRIENASLKELTQLFNGTKTTELEILYSFTIFICEHIGIHNKTFSKKQADAIYNITYTIFREDIDSLNLGNSRNTFSYNENKMDKKSIQKTIIDNTPIFVYEKKSMQINALDKLVQIGTHSLLGIKNDYNQDLPSEDEISELQQIKNLIRYLKSINLIPRYIFFIFSFQQYSSNRLRPYLPLSKY